MKTKIEAVMVKALVSAHVLAGRLYLLAFALTCAFAVNVWAQDGGVPANAVTLPAAALGGDDLGALAKLIWDAVMNKQWGLVASLGVLLVVAGLRKFVPEKTQVGAWLRTKLGGIVSNFVVTLAATFATMFASGHAFSADMVFKALSVALSAAGGWAIYKNVREAIDEKRAQDAGTDAAKKPDDTLNA